MLEFPFLLFLSSKSLFNGFDFIKSLLKIFSYDIATLFNILYLYPKSHTLFNDSFSFDVIVSIFGFISKLFSVSIKIPPV